MIFPYNPYNFTLPELSVLLMSMHVESSKALPRRRTYKKAVMRYIIEETVIAECAENTKSAPPVREEREYCDS